MKAVVYGLLLLCVAGMAASGWFLWRVYDFMYVPPEDPGREVLFLVEPGQPFSVVARNLAEQSLVKDAGQFTALAEERGKTGSIRAGEFRLNTGWLPPTVLEELTSTSGIMHRVQVREGLNWWQTAAIVDQAGFGGVESFKAAVHDPALLRKYGIPADSAEGYLFPETYLLTRPRHPEGRAIVEAMLEEFRHSIHKVWPGGLPSPTAIHETVILASLVEKETGDPSERARIAGVFANRLRRGMLIQADPTVIYGLGPGFDGNLTRADLTDRSNPYNTYAHPGLPPGPICSPGLDALMAAAHPEAHAFLYFVAKGDGSHHFSRTLKEHNAAVAKFQLRRNRKTYRSF